MSIVKEYKCNSDIEIKLYDDGLMSIYDYYNDYETKFSSDEIDTYIKLLNQCSRNTDTNTVQFGSYFKRAFYGNWVKRFRINTILVCVKDFRKEYLDTSEIDIDKINKDTLKDLSIFKLKSIYRKLLNRKES